MPDRYAPARAGLLEGLDKLRAAVDEIREINAPPIMGPGEVTRQIDAALGAIAEAEATVLRARASVPGAARPRVVG